MAKIIIEINTEEASSRDMAILTAVTGQQFQVVQMGEVHQPATAGFGAFNAPAIPAAPARIEAPAAPVAPIAPHDNPAAGAPTSLVDFASMGFGGNAPPPAGAQPIGATGAPLPDFVPPVAPQPPAPAAPQPPAHVAPGQPGHSFGELDADGTPWNAEIHAAPPTLKVDMTWRSKRNVDKGYANTKAEELRRLAAAAGLKTTHVKPEPKEPAAPAASVAPAPGPAAAPQPPAPPSMFAQFMQAITPYVIGSGAPQAILQQTELADIAKSIGLVDAAGNGALGALQQREDMIPLFGQKFNELIAFKQRA